MDHQDCLDLQDLPVQLDLMEKSEELDQLVSLDLKEYKVILEKEDLKDHLEGLEKRDQLGLVVHRDLLVHKVQADSVEKLAIQV